MAVDPLHHKSYDADIPFLSVLSTDTGHSHPRDKALVIFSALFFINSIIAYIRFTFSVKCIEDNIIITYIRIKKLRVRIPRFQIRGLQAVKTHITTISGQHMPATVLTLFSDVITNSDVINNRYVIRICDVTLSLKHVIRHPVPGLKVLL
jgi:hypothetical protein